MLGAQMTAVVAEATGLAARRHISDTAFPLRVGIGAGHAEVESIEEAFAQIPFGIPDEPTPAGGGSGASEHFPFRDTE